MLMGEKKEVGLPQERAPPSQTHPKARYRPRPGFSHFSPVWPFFSLGPRIGAMYRSVIVQEGPRLWHSSADASVDLSAEETKMRKPF